MFKISNNTDLKFSNNKQEKSAHAGIFI